MSVTDVIKGNIGTIGAGVGGVAVGAGLGYLAGSRRTRKKRTGNKNRNSRKRNNRSKKGRRKRYTPHTAGKGKDKSHKRIRYTKKGQPYIIMASGKARFISNKSAKSSRKRIGGRY